MTVFLVILFILLILVSVLYVLSIRPCNSRRDRMEEFKSFYVAHRGLFNNKDIPENSMPAFANAVYHGYAIELDVQITKDDQLVVFHDKTLKRMCNDKRSVSKLTYAELDSLFLLNTGEKIPFFKDVLSLVSGKVPLVVEIKPEGRFIKTAELTDKLLSEYNGSYCIESFQPMVLKWFKEHSPEILRGQLSTVYTKKSLKKPWWMRFLLNNLMLNFISSPDFIAYNHKYKNRFTYRVCRAIYKPFNVAWTIRSQKELVNARDVFDLFIFDSFIPR